MKSFYINFSFFLLFVDFLLLSLLAFKLCDYGPKKLNLYFSVDELLVFADWSLITDTEAILCDKVDLLEF